MLPQVRWTYAFTIAIINRFTIFKAGRKQVDLGYLQFLHDEREYHWRRAHAFYAKQEKPADSAANLILSFAQSVALKIEMRNSALVVRTLKQQRIIAQPK